MAPATRAFIALLLLAGLGAGTQACIRNGFACQWDSAWSHCCSGFCLQGPADSYGVCVPKVVLSLDEACDMSMSRGICCTGYCHQPDPNAWGSCARHSQFTSIC